LLDSLLQEKLSETGEQRDWKGGVFRLEMEKKQGGGGEGKEGGEGKGRKGWVRRPSQKERKKALKRTDNDAKPVEGGGGGFGMGKGGRRDGGGGELVLSKSGAKWSRGGGEKVEKELKRMGSDAKPVEVGGLEFGVERGMRGGGEMVESKKEKKKGLQRTDSDAKPIKGGDGWLGVGIGEGRGRGGGELVLSKGRGGFGGEEVEKELGKNLEVLRLQDSIEESEEEKVFSEPESQLPWDKESMEPLKVHVVQGNK